MFEIGVNSADVVATLDNLAASQIPFALSRAINQTGLDFQVAQRANMGRNFIVRRQQFISREGVKLIGSFATKTNPSVTFGVAGDADFLNKFEAGGEKFAISGGLVAVPESVARDGSGIVPNVLRPRYLFQNFASEVFIIRPGDSQRLVPGIYQRVRQPTGIKVPQRRRGPAPIATGGQQLRMLYALFTETHIRAMLTFEDTARGVVADRFPINFSNEFLQALQRARVGGVPFDASPREL